MKSTTFGRFTTRRVLTTALSIAAIGGVLLGIGGVAGVDAASLHRRDRGQIACVSLHKANEKLGTALDELVLDGTLTAEQQQAIEDRLNSAKADAQVACTGMELIRDRSAGKPVMDLLGMDRLDIRQAWVDGQSLAEMAESQGVTRDDLVSTITTSIDARLTEAVGNGKITEEQKAEILTNLAPTIEAAIDTHIGDVVDRMQEKKSEREAAPATPVSETSGTLSA